MVAPSEARGSTLQGGYGDWKPKGISGFHGRASSRAERLKKARGGGAEEMVRFRSTTNIGQRTEETEGINTQW